MDGFARYALYYAPQAGSALERLGSAWLGYDAAAGRALARPALADLDDPDLVAAPARYGLHGTVKAPFRLAEGRAVEALDAALRGYAARTPPTPIGPLEVAAAHGFVSLRPTRQSQALRDAVFDVVRAFDAFRAPLTEADLARRRAAGLSEAQEANLLAWGYPYVGDELQFHITLTGRLPADRSAAVATALAAYLAPALQEPAVFDGLALFGDPGEGRPFRLLARHRFTGP